MMIKYMRLMSLMSAVSHVVVPISPEYPSSGVLGLGVSSYRSRPAVPLWTAVAVELVP